VRELVHDARSGVSAGQVPDARGLTKLEIALTGDYGEASGGMSYSVQQDTTAGASGSIGTQRAADTEATIGGTLWVARSTSATYYHWFKIAGVELSSSQTNASNRRLEYTPTGAQATICGKNDYPIYATQVKEKA